MRSACVLLLVDFPCILVDCLLIVDFVNEYSEALIIGLACGYDIEKVATCSS